MEEHPDTRLRPLNMRALLQRATYGRVTVGERVCGQIGFGLVVFVGVGEGDTEERARTLAAKTAHLRIFSDADGKFNLSALDTGSEILVVSQFTLYADSRRGRRPSFTDAARPDVAASLCDVFARHLRELGLKVETGEFQADMLVEIHNSGPVTIWLDTEELQRGEK